MKLKCNLVGDIPLPEVSGLAVAGTGVQQLLAVGDRHPAIAATALVAGGLPSEPWQVRDLAEMAGFPPALGDGAQAEAIAAAGSGQTVVLWEHPNLLVVAQGEVVTRAVDLLVAPGGPAGWLLESWADPDSSHGEGLVLLRGGHLLVAKEKDPAAVIEFGPAGEAAIGGSKQAQLGPGMPWEGTGPSLLALAAWEVPSHVMSDISDAAVTAAGELLLLSDQDQALNVVELRPDPAQGVELLASYALRGLSGKPEGVAMTGDGGLLLAVDTRLARQNLYRVAPGWRL